MTRSPKLKKKAIKPVEGSGQLKPADWHHPGELGWHIPKTSLFGILSLVHRYRSFPPDSQDDRYYVDISFKQREGIKVFAGFLRRRGMRLTELIQRSGLPTEQITAWLSGVSEPSRAELRDIALALHVSVRELIAPIDTLPPLNQIRTTLSDVRWSEDRSARWGALPFGPWGYLRLQTTSAGKVRWYPVSAMQAAELDHSIGGHERSAMIVTSTANNRVLLFAMSRIHAAELIDVTTARRRDDFDSAWDGAGFAPEIYRALREWADADILPLTVQTSAATQERLADLIEQIGLRRKQLMPRLDDTIIDHIDNRCLRFAVNAHDLRVAVRNVLLGALTVELSEYRGSRELQLPLECIRLIDLPATDLGLVPAVVFEDSAQVGQDGL